MQVLLESSSPLVSILGACPFSLETTVVGLLHRPGVARYQPQKPEARFNFGREIRQRNPPRDLFHNSPEYVGGRLHAGSAMPFQFTNTLHYITTVTVTWVIIDLL